MITLRRDRLPINPRWLFVVLAAAVIVMAACGGGGDDSDASGTGDASVAEAGDTSAPAADDVDAADMGSDAAGSEQAGADGADTQAAESDNAGNRSDTADASDAFFALDRVLDVRIEIAQEDWDTLRNQTRTLEDVFAEIEEFELSRPFASIYTWFSATVSVDGETLGEVGVRKKGFVGSQSDTKPSLKLRFDKYVDDQLLSGVIKRMTLNNSIQDASMLNTCLTLRVFAAAGNPASRCNFATVSVNGKNLGLYAHVEEIKKPFLRRYFDSADGNLYEGTVSDFTPTYRGTIEKKNNEDADDWSDIDAVVAALQNHTHGGLDALGEIVDLDRFLTFWATEVLVGHWDGYAGDRNNYWFYREPDGRFVFIPWGVDDTFHLRDDPNPFDGISDPPPSVLALSAIPNRLYDHPEWRAAYVERLQELLSTVWDTEELLAAVDEMAAVVQAHALESKRQAAADDADRVRKFIVKRSGEILADLMPVPPEWPEPEGSVSSAGSGTLALGFETTWGSNRSANPFEEGRLDSLTFSGFDQPVEGYAATAGPSSPDDMSLLPGVDDLASIVVLGFDGDGSLLGLTLVADMELLVPGASLVVGVDAFSGGVWSIPPGGTDPDEFSPLLEGRLELSAAGTVSGAAIVGTFTGSYGDEP